MKVTLKKDSSRCMSCLFYTQYLSVFHDVDIELIKKALRCLSL